MRMLPPWRLPFFVDSQAGGSGDGPMTTLIPRSFVCSFSPSFTSLIIVVDETPLQSLDVAEFASPASSITVDMVSTATTSMFSHDIDMANTLVL